MNMTHECLEFVAILNKLQLITTNIVVINGCVYLMSDDGMNYNVHSDFDMVDL